MIFPKQFSGSCFYFRGQGRNTGRGYCHSPNPFLLMRTRGQTFGGPARGCGQDCLEEDPDWGRESRDRGGCQHRAWPTGSEKKRRLEEQPGVMVVSFHGPQIVFAPSVHFTPALWICSGVLTLRWSTWVSMYLTSFTGWGLVGRVVGFLRPVADVFCLFVFPFRNLDIISLRREVIGLAGT